MRYDKTVLLVNETATYNFETGDYDDPVQNARTVYASVMDTRAETMHLIYGEIRQGSYTVQLQNHVEPFDYMMINGKRYAVDFTRKLRHKQTFIVSEMQ